MTRPDLIALVWTWLDAAASRSPELRRGIWRVLDALYADMAVFRTPGYLAEVRAVLEGMKQTEGVVAVRKELGV